MRRKGGVLGNEGGWKRGCGGSGGRGRGVVTVSIFQQRACVCGFKCKLGVSVHRLLVCERGPEISMLSW